MKKAEQKFEIQLNKYSADALDVIREQTGLDTPGAVRFALVVAGSSILYPKATELMRQAAVELGLRDGRNKGTATEAEKQMSSPGGGAAQS